MGEAKNGPWNDDEMYIYIPIYIRTYIYTHTYIDTYITYIGI